MQKDQTKPSLKSPSSSGSTPDSKRGAPKKEERKPLHQLQKAGLGVILAIFFCSLTARAFVGSGSDSSTSTSTGSVSQGEALGLVAPGSNAETSALANPDPGSLESLLPYFSEGSFFGLIGFAVGYASRKVVKLILIFIAILFVALQLLVYGEIATIDWGRFVDVINGLILNLRENETLTEVLKNKIPTTGAFLGGLAIGFRRG